MITRRLLRLAAPAAALALASCISARRPIVLDSTPPGAEVFVDGESSGHSTPCTIQLPDARRTLEFRLEGYDTEVRELRIAGRREVVYWRDAIAPRGTWAFPWNLAVPDLLFPIKSDGGEMPHRIHVRMSRRAAPLAAVR